MVLNNVDYNRKIGALLKDPAYRRLAEGPTDTVEHKTSLLLKRSTFAEEVCKQLHPMGMKLPRLYGLCKIPKESVPIRPIVNNIGAPTYKLSKYLAWLLSPLVEHSSWHMTNSTEFVHSLGSLEVGLEDLMVSFYAVSLYTQVPLGESLNLLSQHHSEDILALFRHVLTSTYFSVGGQFYEQTDGVVMGSPFSPVIGNFVVEDVEKRARANSNHCAGSILLMTLSSSGHMEQRSWRGFLTI